MNCCDCGGFKPDANGGGQESVLVQSAIDEIDTDVTSTAAFTTLTSINMTTQAGFLEIDFFALFSATDVSAVNALITFQFRIDGTPFSATRANSYYDQTGLIGMIGTFAAHYREAVGAGAHTIDVRWQHEEGEAQIFGASFPVAGALRINEVLA